MSAKIIGWEINGRQLINFPENGYGLAKDTFWSPRRLAPVKQLSEIVFPVKDAPYTRGNESFEKKLRLEPVKEGKFIIYSKTTGEAFIVKTDYKKLLQEYTNFGGNPTLEFMCQPYILNPGDIWKMKTEISFQSNLTEGKVKEMVAK